jgi:hypothetical protein
LPKASAPQKPDFEPLTDTSVIARYLQYSSDSLETISFYSPEENLRFAGLAKKINSADLSMNIEIDSPSLRDYDMFKSAAELKRVQSVRLQFSINETYFFATAEIIDVKYTVLTVRVQPPIFKLQRRDAVRVKVGPSFHCTLQMGSQIYTPYDLSASGLCLIVPPENRLFFRLNDIISAAEFSFKEKAAKVDLEVKSILPQKKNNHLKIGLRFLKMASGMEQEIAREAYLYTQKIWSRWI